MRLTDVDDMWTKFLLPFPPNLRVFLGSDTTVHIVPELGSVFADRLNGIGNRGVPMSVVEAWYAAGVRAHQIAASTRNPFKRPGTVRLTAVYRGAADGLPGTFADTVWSYPVPINRDYVNIAKHDRQVWP